MNARKRMQVLADKASNIVDRVEAEGRGRTPDEDRAVAECLAELKEPAFSTRFRFAPTRRLARGFSL